MTKDGFILGLDEFTTAYIECSLWSSTDDNEEPLDESFEARDFTLKSLKEMRRDCVDFQYQNRKDLKALYKKGISPAECGHLFWLNRNRHGAGFWDRGLGEIGERLSESSKIYGSVDLCVYRGKIICQ